MQQPMTGHDLVALLRRRWWIILGLPLVVMALVFWRTHDRPMEVSFRATVVIPGDTEIPGSSERPELMVLDDLPGVVSSRAFAERAHASLPTGTALKVAVVQSALGADRFSRILTVYATHQDGATASAIAAAAAQALPQAINDILIPQGGDPATVTLIDPPGEPALAGTSPVVVVAILGFVSLCAAALFVLGWAWLFPAHREVVAAAPPYASTEAK